MTDTGPLFVSSGDLVSDRRYKAAVELAARGDFAAAADVLMQTVEVAPLRDAMAAAGLKLVALEHAAIRTEKGTPVAGLVVVAITART